MLKFYQKRLERLAQKQDDLYMDLIDFGHVLRSESDKYAKGFNTEPADLARGKAVRASIQVRKALEELATILSKEED